MALKVFHHLAAEGSEWLFIDDARTFKSIAEMSRDPILPGWVAPSITVPRILDGTKVTHSDFPWCGSNVLILRERARELLEPILLRHGELLPLSSDSGDLTLFHCMHYLDALDEERSLVHRYSSSGRIYFIERYEFRPDVIEGEFLFRIPQLVKASRIFFTDKFKTLVEENGLAGMVMVPVWSSDPADAEDIQRGRQVSAGR